MGRDFRGCLRRRPLLAAHFSIRKQVSANLDFADYAQMGAFDGVKVRGPLKAELNHYPEIETELAGLLQDTTPEGVQKALAFAVKNHVTMIISGGTSSASCFHALEWRGSFIRLDIKREMWASMPKQPNGWRR